jgi:hypothetical protein
MIRFFLVFFLLGISMQSHAWYDRGNGGYGVFCKGQPSQALDLYEAESRFKMHVDPAHLSSIQDRVGYLISKIEKLNPRRAALYRSWYKTFDKETEFVPKVNLKPIEDLGFAYFPQDCELKQLVYQREANEALNKARYTIDRSLWDRLPLRDQAALVMHELVYREFSAPPLPHKTSESTRYFNAMLNSLELNKMTMRGYYKKLQEINILTGQAYGVDILVSGWDSERSEWRGFSNTFPKLEEGHTYGHFALDANYTFKHGDFAIKPVCGGQWAMFGPGVRSLGEMSFEDDLVRHIFAEKTSADVEYCDGFYEGPDGFGLLGDTWYFEDNGKPWWVVGHPKKDVRAMIFRPANGWPLISILSSIPNGRYDFIWSEKQDIKKILVVGTACFDGPNKTILILTDSALNGPIIELDLHDLHKEVSKLKDCPPE